MEAFELIGMLLTFAVIALIDMPKLKALAIKKKYLRVYYSVVATGIMIGTLKILQIIPDYFKSLACIYQEISGIK